MNCPYVSVPFSMGTVLHLPRSEESRRTSKKYIHHSVPFSMGTVLHRHTNWKRVWSCTFMVSVPFSMGTVLHRI